MDPSAELFQRDRGFKSGKACPKAEMVAFPKGQVLREVVPIRLEQVSIGKQRLVTIGGRVHDHDPCLLYTSDAADE